MLLWFLRIITARYDVSLLCFLYILLPPSSSFVLSGRFRSSHSNPTLPNFPPLPTARNKNSPRHSCLSPIDAKVWCGVGSDGDDSTTKYLDQDGNPYVVACCREDFCRSAQHLTNHTLFSVEGLFRTLLSLLPNPEPITLPTSFLFFEFRSHFGRFHWNFWILIIILDWLFSTDPESGDSSFLGFGTWELALIIGIPIAVAIVFVMILFSVRHQRRRRMVNRRMVDTENNMDSADVPILG